MKKTDNLRPFTTDQDRSKARENGKTGGIKSGATRRWRKALRGFLQDYLGREAPRELRAWMDTFGIPKADQTNLMALLVSVFSRAMEEGDVVAAETLFKWAGMVPEADELAQAMRQSESEQSISENDSDPVKIYTPPFEESVQIKNRVRPDAL